ncbi:MAG TPA: hypothetical protein VHP83_26365, partial [Aggregatilineaceae bacterium]|nr:hypothetical protein [Aggregatilineaceae bacterium]
MPPNLIDRTFRRLGYIKFRPSSVIHRVESPLFTNEIAPDIAHAEKYASVYAGNPWVYVAVNRIAEAAALVPFRVETSPAGSGDLALHGHPF